MKNMLSRQFLIVLLTVSFVAAIAALVSINIFIPAGESPPLTPPEHVFNWARPPSNGENAKIHLPPTMLDVCQTVIRKTVLSDQEKQHVETMLIEKLAKHSIDIRQRDEILTELKRQDASVEYLQCMLDYQVDHGALSRQTADSIFKR